MCYTINILINFMENSCYFFNNIVLYISIKHNEIYKNKQQRKGLY